MHRVLAQLVFYCGEIEILLEENLLLTLSAFPTRDYLLKENR
jgi:NTP pyrophosphatase (non-canonical NTP hydrolase)